MVHVTSFPFVPQQDKNDSPQDEGDHYSSHLLMHTYEDVGEEKAKNTSCVLSTCFVTYEVAFK